MRSSTTTLPINITVLKGRKGIEAPGMAQNLNIKQRPVLL
jgi:hypothetical protein